jgi:hypothetical protein
MLKPRKEPLITPTYRLHLRSKRRLHNLGRSHHWRESISRQVQSELHPCGGNGQEKLGSMLVPPPFPLARLRGLRTNMACKTTRKFITVTLQNFFLFTETSSFSRSRFLPPNVPQQPFCPLALDPCFQDTKMAAAHVLPPTPIRAPIQYYSPGIRNKFSTE